MTPSGLACRGIRRIGTRGSSCPRRWGALEGPGHVGCRLVVVGNAEQGTATPSSLARYGGTSFMGLQGVDLRRKWFLNCTLSLNDVKFVKNAMKCTVNDVLIGVNSTALSCYYFHKTTSSDDTGGGKRKPQKDLRLRAALLINIRKSGKLQAYMES